MIWWCDDASLNFQNYLDFYFASLCEIVTKPVFFSLPTADATWMNIPVYSIN